jgi:spore coat polysaccharide biosynthesis protein SpsF
MHVTAIIQARMSSHRLPGKVLKTVQGKTMLSYLYERLVHCRSLDSIVISTSTDPSDDPVAAFCRSNRIVHFRGSLLDVAGRFKSTLDYLDCDAFVRVSGDSPLLDQGLVDQAVRLFRTASCDLVTNVFPRSFPAGQSVEVLKRTSFSRGYTQMTEPQDLEHVTPYFYRRHEEYQSYQLFSRPRLPRG